MPRKARAAQVPGAAPKLDTESIPGATLSPETDASRAESRGKVGNADDVIAAEAAPVKPDDRPDPKTLRRAVFVEGEGWLCPEPVRSADNRFAGR